MWEYNYSYPCIAHHGILGQKWGIRRYQNEDGSLTPEGRARLEKYRINETYKVHKKYDSKIDKLNAKFDKYNSLPVNQAIKLDQMKDDRTVELKALERMKYSDMNSERKKIGASWIAAATITAGSVGTSTLLGAPAILFIVPDVGKIKTKSRYAQLGLIQTKKEVKNSK